MVKIRIMRELLLNILNLIDLTTLEGSDNESRVADLCEQAISFKKNNLAYPAAVCVYPVFVRQAKRILRNTPVQVACVAGGFPSGQMPLNLRLKEVKYAIKKGADEVDMVISRGKFLEGDYNFIRKEISKTKRACRGKHLKVILETGELKNNENIRLASTIAIESGADFIKTSTGKISPAATLEAAEVMLNVIKKHYDETGIMIGFKPAGGISEIEDAIAYYNLVDKILGKAWLNNKYFRFGASRLAAKISDKLL